MTPPELLALGRSTAEPDTAGWRVRVVPNKYPAVMLEEKGTPDFRGALSPGYGAHELLIEIPEHNLQPGSFPPRQMELVVEAYYRRGRALANRHCYLQISAPPRSGLPLNIPTPAHRSSLSSRRPLEPKVHTRLTC